MKIGIVGAGPAGITLAKLLSECGDHQISIFEKSGRVGGKALSIYEKGTLYNIGACYVTGGYGLTNKWLKQYGVRRKRLDKAMFIYKDGTEVEFVQGLIAEFGSLGVLHQVLKYFLLWLEFYYLTRLKPTIPSSYLKQLSTPAYDWFQHNRLPFMIKACRRGYQVMGYGVLERTPILHVFRWITPTLLIAAILNLVWEVEDFQSLFEKMAENLDIRHNTPAERIKLGDDGGLDLVTRTEVYRFDVIVIACYLDEAPPGIQEINPTIKSILPQLSYKQWVVSLCRIRRPGQRSFYEDRVISCPDAWEEVQDGKITGFRKAIFGNNAESAEDDRYLCFQLYYDTSNYTPEHSQEMLSAEIEERGGILEKVLFSYTTRYSPTYEPAAVQDQLLESLRTIQGQDQLYFTGPAFSHESVKNIVNFNRYLADKICFDLDGRSDPRWFKFRTIIQKLRPFNL
jgi:hypothetical protein